jgi:dTDP-glucose 4,6-dehydratase
VVRFFVNKYPNHQIFNLDVLTYAGNLENLTDVEGAENYTFLKADICNRNQIYELFEKHQFDTVIHLAAESHVDRSIINPFAFVETNVMGTLNLLHAAKQSWKNSKKQHLFYHISTDEVYGTL